MSSFLRLLRSHVPPPDAVLRGAYLHPLVLPSLSYVFKHSNVYNISSLWLVVRRTIVTGSLFEGFIIRMRRALTLRTSTRMNSDCWLEVFNVLASTQSLREIWRLMQASRALYIIGMPVLVRLWSNALSSSCRYDPECVNRFSRFMLSGDGDRLKHLRRLDIADVVGSHVWDREPLFHLMDGAVNLEELEVEGELFFAYLQASSGVRHFARLRTLTLRSANDVGDTLESMTAPVEKLTLDFDDVDDELEDYEEELPDSLALIPVFRDTLKELNVINGWLENADHAAVYDRLTCLQLENTHIPPVGQMARAFPNLQRLETVFCFADEDNDEFRLANELSQEEGNTWLRLDFISVHRPGFLYGLALACTARCIAFELVDGPEDVELAAVLLATMQPTGLRVGSKSVHALEGILTPIPGSARSVSELHVLLDMAPEGPQPVLGLADSVDKILFSCSALRLTHFMMTVCGPRSQHDHNQTSTDFTSGIHNYDRPELARRLMVMFPALVFIGLCFARQNKAYWEVIVTEGERRLVTISTTKGDSITRTIFPIPSRAEATLFE